jgi:diketogulonate reductase-like aldo/keto reductase
MGTSDTTVSMDQMTPEQVTDRVTEHVEKRLQELGLGYLDMVLLHWPSKPKDDDQDLNRKRRLAAWKVLEGFCKKGWIRAIGVSNFSEHHLTQLAQDGAEITPAVNQIEASVFLQWRDIDKYCQDHDIQLQAFSPLGHGDSNVVNNPVVKQIADKHQKDVGQVAMRYLVQKGYAVVFSSSSPKRLKSNQDIFELELSPDDMNTLETVAGTAESTGQPSPYSLS